MADNSKKTVATIITGMVIVLGIIHLGVGSGIVSRYRQYDDVFRQSVGLSGFNIVIGIFAIIIGIICLAGIMQQQAALIKGGAVCAIILVVAAVTSFITALVLNSQNVTYMRERLLYRINTYAATDSSTFIMSLIQSRYECCGVNIWLDYLSVSLGTTQTNAGGSTVNGRRRRHLEHSSSPLVNFIRKRQTGGTSYTYCNLATGCTLSLPLSCCRDAGITSGNSLGGTCLGTVNNGTSAFYIQGCLPVIANISVSQITGIAVINIVMVILAIVLLIVLITMFPQTFDPNNPNSKQPSPQEMQQEQQMQNGGYVAYNNDNMNNGNMNSGNMNNGSTNYDPNAYYSYPQPQPTYVIYQ